MASASKKLLLLSTSDIKRTAVARVFPDYEIETLKVEGGKEQPFGYNSWYRDSVSSASFRFVAGYTNFISGKISRGEEVDYDMIISIENGICKEKNIYWDVCDVVISFFETHSELTGAAKYKLVDTGTTAFMSLDKFIKVPVPVPEGQRIEKEETGQTAGQLLSEKYDLFKDDERKIYDDKNWMMYFGVDRHDQIEYSIRLAYATSSRSLNQKISSLVVKTPDFPKKGVLFQDYQQVFGDTQLCSDIGFHFIQSLSKSSNLCLDNYVVAGPELRGCILSPFIAQAIGRNCTSVILRKHKEGQQLKMPLYTIKMKELKTKEYKDENQPRELFYCRPELLEGKNVILFDDLLATGGSIKCCIELVRECGGNIKKLCFLADVESLRCKAKEVLGDDYNLVDILVK